jgi:3-hydroxyisobutyrate dehydrogenase-like beta-hydroxyacid dehydrogenase
MKTGFIGLGHMGSAMAANLVKAGHDVTVFNRSPAKRRALLELGAHEATRVADACRGDVVITMLADDTAVADVALRDDGIVGNLPRGAIHVSMSTISVALSNKLAQAHAEIGQRFVAAPVFGRPDAAAAAKLFIVAAGDPAAVEACKPLFDALGQKTVPISAEPGAANLVKLSGNFLLAAAIEALGEAIALVGKAGIDRRSYVDLLSATIFPAPAYKTYGGLIANDKFQPAAFAGGGRDSAGTDAAWQPAARPISPAPGPGRRASRLGCHRWPRGTGCRRSDFLPVMSAERRATQHRSPSFIEVVEAYPKPA